MTPGGPGTTIANAVPGQNMALTFAGTAGQRISLKTTGSSLSYVLMSIKKPDGAALGAQAVFGSSGKSTIAPTLGAPSTSSALPTASS